MDGQRDTSPPPAAPVTNWERQCVTLAGYCYAVSHGLKVHLVTPYRVSLLHRYGVTVRGNVTSVYPLLVYFNTVAPISDQMLQYIILLNKLLLTCSLRYSDFWNTLYFKQNNRIFGPKAEEVIEGQKGDTYRSFVMSVLHQSLFIVTR